MERTFSASQTTTNPPVHFCGVCVAVRVDELGASCATCQKHPIVIEISDQMPPIKMLKIAASILGIITAWVIIRALLF